MDKRTDPVEILARVPEYDGKQRAFDVWVHKAHKAGWPVTVESSATEQPGDECGVVEIEGLRYRVRFAKRVRQRVAVVAEDKHLIAAAVGLTLGRTEDVVEWAAEFRHAAWAEPLLDD